MSYYLPVDVYVNQDGRECTNGGVSSDPNNQFVVPCERGHVSEETVEKYGYIVLEPMPAAFDGCPVRFKQRGEKRWAMAGGNFIYTSDSRFSETYGSNPKSVHDRIE